MLECVGEQQKERVNNIKGTHKHTHTDTHRKRERVDDHERIECLVVTFRDQDISEKLTLPHVN